MSMGLSLMLDVMGENPTNRCLRISLPRLVTTPRNLELFRIIFGNKIIADEKQIFDKHWADFKELQEQEGIDVCGGWLEPDGAIPHDLSRMIGCLKGGTRSCILWACF
jgi:hypothetical protein